MIVIGLGGVGSSAAYHLANSGARVLGLDRFGPVHDRGSSHGQTRAIRQAYFEHPAYVPMLRRAYELWDELEQSSGQKLFHRTGLVQIGPADGVVVPGVLRSAQEHGLDVEETSMIDITKRWPAMRGEENWRAVVENSAGFLLVEKCVSAHLDLAKKSGAELRHQDSVIRWRSVSDHIEVETATSTERADKIVVAAGAWASLILSEIGMPLRVLRKYQYWFSPSGSQYELHSGFPCFFFETRHGFFYGFPNIESRGVKVARHSGGQVVEQPAAAPDQDHDDQKRVKKFNESHLRHLSSDPRSQSGCFYTTTPDEHFVVDTAPCNDRVVVFAGLSGHGFKFTSVLGEMAASIALNEENNFCLPLFHLARFGF